MKNSSREEWTIIQYKDELEKLNYLYDNLDPSTYEFIKMLLENEMESKFGTE